MNSTACSSVSVSLAIENEGVSTPVTDRDLVAESSLRLIDDVGEVWSRLLVGVAAIGRCEMVAFRRVENVRETVGAAVLVFSGPTRVRVSIAEKVTDAESDNSSVCD